MALVVVDAVVRVVALHDGPGLAAVEAAALVAGDGGEYGVAV